MRNSKLWVKRLITASLSLSMIAGAPVSTLSSINAMAAEEDGLAAESEELSEVYDDKDLVEETVSDETITPENEEATVSEEEVTANEKDATVSENLLTDEEDVPEDSEDQATDFETYEAEVEVLGDGGDDDSEDKKQAAKDTQNHDVETINDSSSVSRNSIHDGTILHAFCWDFETIKEMMPQIAKAGFTAVQTSPINTCLDTNPALELNGSGENGGKWYYHYQPTDWKIGNYQLGDRDAFKEMCDTADEYGIGIIVDILPNHTTPMDDQVSQTLIDAAGGWDSLYHKEYKEGVDYGNRVSVVYNAMGGLYDVDTENHDFQDYFYAYLDDCINCGADGFRIDTAKHIALPDDGVPASYAGEEDRNDFYPNMVTAINAYSEKAGKKAYDNLFVYGEVLQGTDDRLAAYQQYIGGTTASSYGGSIRNAVVSNNLSVSNLESYNINDEENYKADDNKLVTWVESHDNYINDKSYESVNDRDTVLGWAIIAARKDGTPLFFSRPKNSTVENPFGDNVIGEAGNDLFKAPEVTAVNKFRKEMAGDEEKLSNPGDKHALMIERYDENGAEGAVLVNAAAYSVAVKGETKLADGAYVNTVEGAGDLFIVKDGVIDGILQAESVVVLTEASQDTYTTVHFNNSANWDNVQAVVDSADPVKAVSENDGWFRVNVPASDFTISFTNGSDTTPEYSITGGNEAFITREKSEVFSSKDAADAALGLKTKSVYFFNTELWEEVNAYSWYYDGEKSTEFTRGWPGNTAFDDGGYWYRADIKMPAATDQFSIIFNTDGSQTSDVLIDDDNVYLAFDKTAGNTAVKKYASKEAAEAELGISANSTTIYFYNSDNWDTVCAYTWEACSLGDWPGAACEEDGDGWWKITVPAGAGPDLNIIFNNGNNGAQTKDLKIQNIKSRYVNNGRTFESKEAAVGYRPGEAVKVYYHDENNWESNCAYFWADNRPDICGGWPGLQMTSMGDNWYYVEVPSDEIGIGDLHMIISNNGNDQLPDKIITDTLKVYFNTADINGYATAEEAFGGSEAPGTDEPETPGTDEPETPGTDEPQNPGTDEPSNPGTNEPSNPGTDEPSNHGTNEPTNPAGEQPATTNPAPADTKVEATGISLDAKKISIGKGGKYKLTAKITPENATDKDVVFSSSNEKIATVSADGTVNAKKTGKCVITAATKDGKYQASCKVTVTKAVKVTGVKLNKKSKTLKVGKSFKLKATLKPKDATITDVKWKSSNKKVAKVDSEGNVKAVGKGSCTITVKTKDGSYEASCKITVKK